MFPDPSRIKPMQQVVEHSGNAVIQCISFTQPRWKFFGGQAAPSNAIIDVNVVLLTNVVVENGGVYECKGTTDNGLKFWATSTVYVASKLLHQVK